ncbi:MAG: hypothetical protein QXY40_04740 [Candidatus Methanomethylicia archaeon]
MIQVNTGHLKNHDRRRSPATYAIVDFYIGRVNVEIYTLRSDDIW